MNNDIVRVSILLGGGTNICSYWSPSKPIPIPSVAKVSCQGANKLKTTLFYYFLWLFYKLINESSEN